MQFSLASVFSKCLNSSMYFKDCILARAVQGSALVPFWVLGQWVL
jgi:hypothetical protein